MRQGAFCTKVGTLAGTDYRVQPRYMDMLDLAEAWRFGRGAGQKRGRDRHRGQRPSAADRILSAAVTMWWPVGMACPTVMRTERLWRH